LGVRECLEAQGWGCQDVTRGVLVQQDTDPYTSRVLSGSEWERNQGVTTVNLHCVEDGSCFLDVFLVW